MACGTTIPVSSHPVLLTVNLPSVYLTPVVREYYNTRRGRVPGVKLTSR